ncbi:3D domain-containing protein [Bacillus taeanensis]|uniref:Peptidoglycan-binding protein n=1 Tax=Bacillus taeanensis TaxID=273032 RepID=A0A366XS03_9BACI|nr:3D domain-containing protein [Bacillus taeanensis]RBW68677.1 peptidoglycan-binding protein [Bacillus taeanensis]
MKKSVLALTAAATLTTGFAGEAYAESYRVKAGDTLWSIANNHSTTVDQVKAWNNLSSNIIYPNQDLEISEGSRKAAVNHTNTYEIKAGDTLWSISQKFGVSVSDLKAWNGLSSDLIYAGRSLNINGSGSAQAQVKASTHVVQKTSNPAPASQEKPAAAVKEVSVTATAYTAYCTGCSGVTATGVDLRSNPNQKVIAVDPNVIPLGSEVYVEGYGHAIAADTGGAIKGNRIDVFIPTKDQAFDWGVKEVKVQILN